MIDYNAMTEAERIAAVSQNGYIIQYIKSPSEAVCLAAVSDAGPAIKHIQNPSEAVCMAAVQKIGYVIKHIKTPSEAVCMAAVQQEGWVIQFIKNPSEAVQIEAVKLDTEALTGILKPGSDSVVAIHLLHHPLSPHTPQKIIDRAPKILEKYCAGLGDVYLIGLTINMTSEELSRTMLEWIDSHLDLHKDDDTLTMGV